MDDYDEMDALNADGGGDDEAQNPQNAHNPAQGDDVPPRRGGADGGDNAAGPSANAPAPNDGDPHAARETDPQGLSPSEDRGNRHNRGTDSDGDRASGGDDDDEDPDEFDDAEPTPGLSHKQEQAILALLAEPTVARAAKVAKVGVRTLHRWLREEAFGKAYRLARRESFAQAVSLTQRYAALAVQTLAKVMNDESAPVASRVAAATSMLKFARDSIELDDLADRVEALERSAKDRASAAAGTGAMGMAA